MRPVLLCIVLLLLSPQWSQSQTGALIEFAQGLHLYQEDRLEEALPHFRQAADQAPHNADFHFYLGATLAQLGHYREAIDPLQESLTLRPEFPLGQFFLGVSHFHVGQREEARKLLEQAPEEEAMKHLYLGLIEFGKKRYAEAIPFLQKASALDETLSGQVSYYLGVAHYHLHDFEQSNTHFLTTLQRGADTAHGAIVRDFLQLPELQPEERRKRVNDFWITLTFDDNVVIEPDDPQWAYGLSNNGDAQGGLAFNGWRRYHVSPHFALVPSYFFYRSIHQSFGQYDLTTLRTGLEVEYRRKQMGLEVEGFYNYNFLQEDSYFRRAGVRLTPSFEWRQLAVGVDFTWFDERFFELRPRSGQTRLAGVWGSLYFSFRRQGGVRIGYHQSDANARDDYTYDGDRISAELTLFLPWKLILVPGVTWYQNEYENLSLLGSVVPEFNAMRDDDGVTVGLSLYRQLNQQTFLNVSFTNIAHDSNISFYDYDRKILTAGFLFRL